MKKKISIIICIILVVAIGVIFTGCLQNDNLAKLSKALNDSVEATNNVDMVANEDLQESNMDEMSINCQTSNFVPMSLTTNTIETNIYQMAAISTIDKIGEIMDMREEIKTKHFYTIAEKEKLDLVVVEIKANIKAYRNQENKLTDEENATIDAYVAEIIEITDGVKATIGKVYLPIKELRGKYNLANIDLVHSTLTNVNTQIDIRVESVDRLNIIAADINQILLNKLPE